MMFLQVMIDNVGDVFHIFAYFNAYFASSAFPWRCKNKHRV